jgi:hypothetical protein
VFCGGRSSILSKRELCENAKKFFCLLWKHFRRKGIKEVFKKKKRRRGTQTKLYFNILEHEKEFLLKIQQFADEDVISDWLLKIRGPRAKIIPNLKESFSKRDFQGNFSLGLALKQIRDLVFSGISEGIGVFKSADICRSKGEISFLSLVPGIFRALYQKVAVFLFFVSIISNYYQKQIILDKKTIITNSMRNDSILLAKGSCKKTIEVQELRKQTNSGEQGFRLIKRKLQNAWI